MLTIGWLSSILTYSYVTIYPSLRELSQLPLIFSEGINSLCCVIGKFYLSYTVGRCGGRPRVRFPEVSLEFFIELILQAALWPCGSHIL